MAEKTRRELLSEAWDKTDEDEEVATLEEGKENEPPVHGDGDVEPEHLEGEGEAEDTTDKSGLRGIEKTEEVGKKSKEDETQRKETEAAAADDKADKGNVAPTDKAPQSWKPATREHWGKIPAEARAEITRREKEIQTTLSQTANVRKFAGDFANVVNPFAHIIRQQNSTPLQAVHNLMSTAAALVQGSQQQKSAIVAEIMHNYGVDMLEFDKYLTANWDPEQSRLKHLPARRGVEQPPEWARPIIQSHQELEQARTQRQQQLREKADEQIAVFEDKPYFEDVRDDVADILSLAAERGRVMTMQQAYDKACQLHPEVSKLIAKTKVNGKQPITRARRAASTVSGAPSGRATGAEGGGKKTRREMLNEAWEDAT